MEKEQYFQLNLLITANTSKLDVGA